MALVVTGVVVILIGFAWMVACASAGWSSAWWYFEWQQFKLILGAHLLIGAVLIGEGLRRRFLSRRSAD